MGLLEFLQATCCLPGPLLEFLNSVNFVSTLALHNNFFSPLLLLPFSVAATLSRILFHWGKTKHNHHCYSRPIVSRVAPQQIALCQPKAPGSQVLGSVPSAGGAAAAS